MEEESTPILDLDVVIEILSWLELKALSRAQLVCKEWRTAIQDNNFTQKHMSRSSYFRHWYNVKCSDESAIPRISYRYLDGCDGLVLIKNNSSEAHFLWNPASRLALQLPTAAHIGSYGFALSFVPATKNYKIVCFYKNIGSGQHGCRVVTAGSCMAWRELALPDVVNGNLQLRTSVVPVRGAVHSVLIKEVCKDEIVAEIASLDVETELFTMNRFPTGVFDDIKAARAIECNGKLGFGDVVGQDLHLMVLEDYKKKRWCSEKQVIHLPFLKDKAFEGIDDIKILLIKEGEMWFVMEREKVYVYTIETGKVRLVEECKEYSLSTKLFNYKPSLVTVEGMQQPIEEHLDDYRPRQLTL